MENIVEITMEQILKNNKAFAEMGTDDSPIRGGVGKHDTNIFEPKFSREELIKGLTRYGRNQSMLND